MPDEGTQEERIQRPGGEEDKKRWSMPFIRQSRHRLRRRLAELRVMISQDKSDEEIAELTGVEFDTLEKLKDELYKQDRAAIDSADPVSIFIKYCISQEGIIYELNKVITKFMDTNQGSALVGAIKEKSQIYDRVIKMGQDLGLIERVGSGALEIPGGESLAGRDPDEVRELIQEELDSINDLLDDAKKPLQIIKGGQK